MRPEAQVPTQGHRRVGEEIEAPRVDVLADEQGVADLLARPIGGSGIELRGEGGSFHDRNTGDRYTEFIFGAEYGFANSLTLLGEYRFSDKTGIDYIGGNAGYQPAMLWFCNLVMVVNLDDHSGFAGPSLEYSLSDEMTLSAGAFIYFGGDDDEFGQVPYRYYLRWFVHF